MPYGRSKAKGRKKASYGRRAYTQRYTRKSASRGRRSAGRSRRAAPAVMRLEIVQTTAPAIASPVAGVTPAASPKKRTARA